MNSLMREERKYTFHPPGGADSNSGASPSHSVASFGSGFVVGNARIQDCAA
ncbi:MAG: hypothetical protein M2R45_02002 [Verrucomicrobia subdivision 3 bacterium]|nr:hypothetical protein [Limisphaerales bacterium]MCS1414820.1 hypothetical protein [Limisphaerales bacterium]